MPSLATAAGTEGMEGGEKLEREDQRSEGNQENEDHQEKREENDHSREGEEKDWGMGSGRDVLGKAHVPGGLRPSEPSETPAHQVWQAGL